MLNQLWKFFGSLNLTLWSIVSTVFFFLLGMLYSAMNYGFFYQLNEIRIQDWLLQNLIPHLAITWWLPFLLLSLAMLWLNTFVCSIDRVLTILKMSKKYSLRKYFNILSPTLIHWLFLIVMFGHFITFTTGEWKRFSLKENNVITVKKDSTLTVKSIKNIYYDEDSSFKNRISQTEVLCLDNDNKEIKLSYLNPVSYKGYKLHLNMIKKRGAKHTHNNSQNKKIDINQKKDETCNKEHIYNIQENKIKKERKLQILIIKDPGLNVTIFAFILILVIMTWYYIEASLDRRNKGKNVN